MTGPKPKITGPMLDPGLCRCCRSIKRCRILNAEYTWMEQKEIYADMIMDCFGVLLSHLDASSREAAVCATCVVRLREASAFKRQLLQCEELYLQARDNYTNVEHDEKKDLPLEPKPEPKDNVSEHDSVREPSPGHYEHEPSPGHYEHEPSPGLYDDVDETYYVAEQKIGPAHPPHPPPPPPPPPPPDTDEKPPKLEARADEPHVQVLQHVTSQSSDDDDLPLIHAAGKRGKRERHTRGPKRKRDGKKAVKLESKKSPKLIRKPIEKRDTTDRDLDYMAEENLLTIVEFSFVCPFKNRRNNYYCYYCKDYYPKPEDLREHTVTHDTKPFQLLMGYKKMPKLDITRIDCRLCSEPINDIDTFKSHIDSVHGKKIYFEAPDKLLLYRLTWNNLKCVMCTNVFEDFNGLNTHMVEHFSNYTCDMCGMCFLEKPRLDAHLKRHRDEEKHTCEVCGKVFKSNHYKDMHVDIVHKKKAIIRCPKCDECFMSYALKNRHLTEAHGQKRVYPCNLCDKVYNRQKTLTEHQRRNHQKVLKHQCEYCEQRFYLPSRLKEHMATHTGERNFHCEHCDKSYPRLKSLQYHIRTHTNDRRYRCEVCGQAFIQNASLKSHLKSHHPESEVEGCYF